MAELVFEFLSFPCQITRLFFKYENEEIEFCGSNWNEAFAAEDYPIHRNRAVQMLSTRWLVEIIFQPEQKRLELSIQRKLYCEVLFGYVCDRERVPTSFSFK